MDTFTIETGLIKMEQRSNIYICTSCDNAFEPKYARDLLLFAILRHLGKRTSVAMVVGFVMLRTRFLIISLNK